MPPLNRLDPWGELVDKDQADARWLRVGGWLSSLLGANLKTCNPGFVFRDPSSSHCWFVSGGVGAALFDAIVGHESIDEVEAEE